MTSDYDPAVAGEAPVLRDAPPPPRFFPAQQPDDWSEIGAALLAIARWEKNRGRGDYRPFVRLALGGDAPEHLLDAVESLRDLTYERLVGEAQDRDAGVQQVESEIAQLDAREFDILVARIIATQPATLAELGARWGVSHQRIAQLEQQLRAGVADMVRPDSFLGHMIPAIIAEARPLIRFEALVDLFPGLVTVIPRIDIPVWRLMSLVVDGIEFGEGWVASPSLAEVKAQTRAALADAAVATGVTPLATLPRLGGLTRDEALEWVARCGYRRFEGHLVEPAGTATGMAAQILHIWGRPATTTELVEAMALLGQPRGAAGLLASLRRDPRFAVDAAGAWSLVDTPDAPE